MAQRAVRVLLFPSLVLTCALFFMACASSAPTPTPTATPTPSPTPNFKQKRTDVLRYVLAFNNINNDLNTVFAQVQFPESTDSAEDRLAFKGAVTSILTAIDGALAHDTEVQPSALDPDTSTHNESARAYLQKLKQTLEGLRQAVSADDSTRLAQQLTHLELLEEEASSINRKTEQLMFKYDLSGEEAAYRVRGF